MFETELTQSNRDQVEAIVANATIEKKLGISNLGSIYLINHPDYGKSTLKILEGRVTQKESFLKRFLNDVEKAKRIKNKNFPKIYEVGKEETFYVIREYIQGVTLQEYVHQQQKLTLEETNNIIQQIIYALQVAHKYGFLHKNLKPSNIIIEDEVAKVVDFSMPPTLPYYLSPEQCKGKKSNVLSDIYAIGAIYIFCVTGKAPYCIGSPREIMTAHISEPVPNLAFQRKDIPIEIVELIKKMMEKTPENRPQNYHEIKSILNNFTTITNHYPEIDTRAIRKADLYDNNNDVSTEEEPTLEEPTIELVAMETPSQQKERINKFKMVVDKMGSKLKTINQTLALLNNTFDSQGAESLLFLDEMLHFITTKTGELMGADHTIFFMVDKEKQELWSLMEKDESGNIIETRISLGEGIAGEVVSGKGSVNIAYDFYNDPRSGSRKSVERRIGYRTYTMLTTPLLNRQGEVVAVVQLLNKLKLVNDPKAPLLERIDQNGFSQSDQELFKEFAPSIKLILESSASFYKAIQRQRAAEALMAATQSLSKSSLDLEDTLKRVMDEAEKLMNADRSSLWLVDNDRKEMWTKIKIADGTLKEIRIPKTEGFVGQVANSGKPLLIPFDLYDHPDSEMAKKVDQVTGYRTCSMLCMPVFNNDNELIGVTQLINKKRKGEYGSYDSGDWPEAPDCWKASFNRFDMEFMEAFNTQAGVALQNAKLFTTVKQQEQMQRDILRSISNGLISVDKDGKIVAMNESAKKLIGIQDEEKIEQEQIKNLIKIKDADFASWLDIALNEEESKEMYQYYPEQNLLSAEGESHSINLSINAIADVSDTSHICGAVLAMDDISHEKRIKTMMYRYMSQEVAEQLLTSGRTVKLGGQRRNVTVLFSDIRGYTTLTEGMQAEEVVDMLNEYFEEMVDVIFKYKGTLDKYIGDAIMAVFGVPLPLEDHELRAMKTALDMRECLKAFNEKRKSENKLTIKIGIGIHSDEVINGNIGSSKRMELTSIGDGVNLASRLEGASKPYGCDIIISEKTYDRFKDEVHARELDYITVKGKTEPVKIYDLIALKSEDLDEQKIKLIENYEKGRRRYTDREFGKAMVNFGRVLEIAPDDKAAKLHLERCRHFLESPPDENWDGVWRLTSK